MDLSIEDARDDLRATRNQIANTADELSDRVHQGVESAKRKVNPLDYAREYPWPAIGIAAAIGLGLSLSGADKKAARAAAKGAKAAGGALASGAVALKDQAVEAVQHHGDSAPAAEEADANAEPSMGDRIRDRVQSSIHDLLAHGLNELMRDLHR